MTICTECDKRSTCQELCPEAEEYVNQDYVDQKDIQTSVDMLDLLPNLRMFRPKDEYTPHELKVLILQLHSDGMSRYGIEYHLPCSRQYAGQVIKEYLYGGDIKMKCYICGKKATIKHTDPFFDELPQLLPEGIENKEEWWCEECYKERQYDI